MTGCSRSIHSRDQALGLSQFKASVVSQRVQVPSDIKQEPLVPDHAQSLEFADATRPRNMIVVSQS